MRLLETSLLYAVIGLAVATAYTLQKSANPIERSGRFLIALLFWPFFAPVLLASSAPKQPEPTPHTVEGSRIDAIQSNLIASLERLQGTIGEVVAPEVARVRGLSSSVAAMERRVAEMDKLLSTPEFDARTAQAALDALTTRGLDDADPRVQSVRTRLRNIERLQQIRRRTVENIERIVLKLEEMSSQLRLLEFAGRPDTEVVGMIKDIAGAVENIAEGVLAADVPATA